MPRKRLLEWERFGKGDQQRQEKSSRDNESMMVIVLGIRFGRMETGPKKGGGVDDEMVSRGQ